MILAAGWVFTRDSSGPSSSTTAVVETDITITCPPAFKVACDGLATKFGAARTTYRAGQSLDSGTVLIGFGSDLPPELAAVPFARSPIAIAMWGERADTLIGTCGKIDVSCLVAQAGTSWPELGGSAGWGTLFLGLADPNSGIGALEAWRLVDAADPGTGFGGSVPLRGSDDGDLLSNLVLFSSRADAVVASEVAIASQLENARARAGRLAVFYPDPSPFLAVVAHGEGRAARNLVDSLTEADIQDMLGSLGLRPISGEATNLLRDLGTPGAEMTGVSAAERTTLLDSWNTMVGG